MTKHTSEPITPQTILHRFELYNNEVERIRKQNLDAGLDVKRNNDYAPQNHLNQQEVYEKFLKTATNPKTKKWYTPQSLSAAGEIPDTDLEQFENREYPYARLNRLTRVRTRDGKEYLERMFTLYALTREGNPTHKVIKEADYWHKPIVSYQYVPQDPKDEEGKQIRVGIIRDGGYGWGNEPVGQKVNLTEYSENKVHQILKEIPPNGDFTDLYNGTTLTFVKVGETQDTMVVRTLSEFFEDFETVWKRNRTIPNPNVDIKALIAELQKQSLAAVEHSGQYQ
jgi:hypothetical protein